MNEYEKIKSRAQFFKRGSIIPTRVLRCSKRRLQHLVKFGRDSWVLPTKTGYVIVCDAQHCTGQPPIDFRGYRLKGMVYLDGSPYHKGESLWMAPYGEDFEQEVLRAIAEKNGEMPSTPAFLMDAELEGLNP
ncbi:hypothetical protein A3K88_02930 [Pseudomonas putida]|nr:hypothetical protein A3K88_02930 [Pseudomonas putida]